MKKLFLQSGKLMVGEFPEEPKWHEIPATPSGCDYEIRDEQRDEYNSAVTAARDSAVEVTKPDQNIQLAFALALGSLMKEGQLYDMPEGWTVEFEYYVSDVNDPTVWQVVTPELYEAAKKHPESGRSVKQEAPLIPLKEPEITDQERIDRCHGFTPFISQKQSGIVATGLPERDTTANDRTEPTVNTIIDRIGELYEGLKDLHHAQEVYDKSGEFFASLQELRNIACVAVKSVSPPPQAESQEGLIRDLLSNYTRSWLEVKSMSPEEDALIGRIADKFTIIRKP